MVRGQQHILMTAEYPYLNLSLRYVHGTKSTTVFSYPSKIKAPKAPFDAARIISRFVNLSEFYVLGCHDARRFYSFISVDDADHTGARLELTLTTDSDVLLPGRTVLNLINSIKEMLEHDEPFNDETLASALTSSGFPAEPLRSSARYQGNTIADKPCYRTYVSATELATIMSFPRQSSYAPYSEVALVHVTSAPVTEDPLPQISETVSQAFTVVCPKDVTPSAESVEITDHLALTYTRAGFEPATVSFEVGTTNRYVRISGPALIVNDAEKAGIVFTQRIAYEVKSSKGNTVNAYTILINGRTATRADGSFEVNSSDFNSDGKVNISVSSTNFFTTSIDLTCEELLAAQPLELVLVPEELPVTLRLDFGEGRTMEQEILLEKSSPEYCRLRAGSFHGFRAHRLMGHEPETYNIDMATVAHTAPARPAEPQRVERPVRKETPAAAAATVPVAAAEETTVKAEAQKPEQEVQEPQQPARPTRIDRPKSAAELRAEKLRNDIPQKMTDEEKKADKKADKKRKQPLPYADELPKKVDILKDDPDPDEEQRRPLSPMIIAAVAVVLITVGIVWYLFTLLPSDKTDEMAENNTELLDSDDSQGRISVIDDIPDETTQQQPDQAQAAPAEQPAQSGALTPEEKADIEYLNSHDVWRPADMKSEKFRQFFQKFSEGDIDALANSDYYAVKDAATNRKAIQVIEFIWKSKGTFQENNNRKVLKATQGNESIDLSKIVDDLARRQDTKPNTEPRPER